MKVKPLSGGWASAVGGRNGYDSNSTVYPPRAIPVYSAQRPEAGVLYQRSLESSLWVSTLKFNTEGWTPTGRTVRGRTTSGMVTLRVWYGEQTVL